MLPKAFGKFLCGLGWHSCPPPAAEGPIRYTGESTGTKHGRYYQAVQIGTASCRRCGAEKCSAWRGWIRPDCDKRVGKWETVSLQKKALLENFPSSLPPICRY